LDLDNLLKKIDKLAADIDVKKPWEHPQALNWDRITLDEWIRKSSWTKEAKAAVEAGTTMIFACETFEVSLLYFLYYIKNTGGSIMRLLDCKGGAQEERLVGGTQQISNKLGRLIGMESIKFNAPVRKIHQNEKQVTIHCDIGVFKSKYVVLAIPPTLAGKIEYSPQLPSYRNDLTEKFPMGSVIKTLMFYKKAFWREKGYSGQVVSSDSSKCADFPITATFDDSDHELISPCIVGFMNGGSAKFWAESTPEERKKAVCKQYAYQMGMKEFLEPVHYEEKLWMNEEWSKGCYVGYLPPGVLTSSGKGLRDPIGRIHFAGCEAATKWTGYMEGALEAGENAANDLKELLH